MIYNEIMNLVSRLVTMNNLSSGLIVLSDLVKGTRAYVMIDSNTAPFLGSFHMIIWKV